MEESSEKSSRLGIIILTGIISLIVGVSGGLIVNYFTERKAGLEYDIVSSSLFAGQTQRVAIVGLNVTNPGAKEVEDINCQIEFGNSNITELKVVGLNPSAYNTKISNNRLDLKAPYLNPRESFSIQLLLGTTETELKPPLISIRGRGVTAYQKPTISEKRKISQIISLLAAAFSALLPLIAIRRILPRFFFTKRHRDDQRDIFAFVLGVNGFYAEAEAIRNSVRSLSYWSESDRLAERCLISKDVSTIERGISCLRHLLEYAGMSDTSRLIVHYNIARLAAAKGDNTLVNDHLKVARKGKHAVIEKRIAFDSNLAKVRKV